MVWRPKERWVAPVVLAIAVIDLGAFVKDRGERPFQTLARANVRPVQFIARARLGFPGQTVGPGRRVSPNSTGTIVAQDGKPWLALGSPGVPPQPVTQILVNIIDFGMDPGDAADAPRFFAFRTNERVLAIESRISDDVRKGLKARGIKIEDLGPYNWHTGSMQIVWRDPETGKLHGVSDPRRLGRAAGF